jgi:hypothetical protein
MSISYYCNYGKQSYESNCGTNILTENEIAEKYRKAHKTTECDNKIIFCHVGDKMWTEYIPNDHTMQLMMQLTVISPAKLCCYIVATAGVRNSKGSIIYVIMAKLVKDIYHDFKKRLYDAFRKELDAFYSMKSSSELLEAL